MYLRVIRAAATAAVIMMMGLAGARSEEPAGGGGGEGGVPTTIVVPSPRPRPGGSEILKGTVLGHDEEGFTFLPAETDTPVTIPWSGLHRREAARIRKLLGGRSAPGAPADDELVEVTVITTKTDARFEGVEVAGRSTPEAVCLERRGMVVSVPREIVARTSKEKRPARLYLSPEARYERRRAGFDRNTAKGHFEAAAYCGKIGLAEKGIEHLEKCRVLDDRYVPRTEKLMAELKAQLLRAKAPRPAGPAAARPTEAELRRLVVSRWYTAIDEALHDFVRKGIAEMVVPMRLIRIKGSNEVYRGVVKEETEDEILLWNADTMTEVRIAKNMIHSNTARPTPKKVRAATFAEAKAYVTDAQGGIGAEVAGKVAAACGVGESQAREIWEGRLKKRIRHSEDGTKKILPRYYSLREANYGPGSWLRDAGTGAAPAAGGGAGGAAAPDPEQWWKSCPAESRVAVLRAICYEALLDVVSVKTTKCSGCGGKGRTIAIDPVGAASWAICTVCRGKGVEYKIVCR